MSNRKAQAGRFNRGASFALALFVFVLCTTAIVMVANVFSWGSGAISAVSQSSQQAALPGGQASAADGQLMQQGGLAKGDGASMVATRSSGVALQTARMDPGNGSALTPLAEEEPAIQDDSVENEPSQGDAVLEDQYEEQDQGDTYVEDEGSDDQAELTEQIDERIIETSLQCVDGHIYVVRISYDDFANIPEGSQLKLVELNQSLTREESADPANRNRPYETERFVSQTDLLKRGEVLDKYLELQEGDWRYAAKYLDVKLVDANGEEVKPAAPVEMTIETTFLPVQQGGTLELAWQFPVTNPTPEDPYAYERMELDDKTDEVSTKASFLTDHFGELAVAGVARTVNTWDVEGTKVYLLGAKTLKSVDLQGIEVDSGKEGWETREAYVANVDPAPWYGTTMWLSAKPAEASSEGLGFLRGFRVRDGVLAGKIFAQGGTTEPVAFRADEEGFAFVWDTGYRRQALGVGNVTVEGMMPQGTELTAKGMRSAFPDPTELNEGLTAQAEDEGVELATAAAYDISLASAGQDYQPGEGTPVTVSITSVNINEGGSYQVWHVLDDGTVEVVEGATVVGNTITFEATGFSVYLVVSTTTLTKTLTASDGKTYQVTVTCEGDAGVPANAELEVSEIREGDEGYEGYVSAGAEAVGATPESVTLARAFDIKLRDPETGEECRPTKPVAVSIRLLDESVQEGSEISVVHFPDEPGMAAQSEGGDGGPEVLPASVSGDAVEFETSGFSVYVIIDHEGGVIENPRVEFHFIDHYTDAQYEARIDVSQTTQSTPYNFVNTAGRYQTTQILKDGEKMELITEPDNIHVGGAEKYFYGWYVVNEESDTSTLNTVTGKYTGTISFKWPQNPDQVKFEQAIAITTDAGADGELKAGDTLEWTMGEVSGQGTLDSAGTVHVYLAPLYEDFFFVNFHKGPKENVGGLANSLMTRKLVVFGSANAAEVRIGNVKCESPDPAHQIFAGWESVKTVNNATVTDEYYRTVDFAGNEVNSPGHDDGYYITVIKTDSSVGSLELYPVFAEARWIYFNAGKSGNGSTYVPAAYRLTNDDRPDGEDSDDYYFDNTFFTSHLSSRPGYTLEGWYAFAKIDGETGEISNLTEAQDVEVKYVENGETHTVIYHTTAIKLADINWNDPDHPSVAIKNIGSYYISNGAVSITGAQDEMLFSTADGKLRFYKTLDDMTLCANWTADSVEYTVVYWLENANNDDYSLIHYETKQGVAGQQTAAEALSAGSTVYSENKLKFAHLSTDQDKAADGNQTGIQQKKIAGDGSTIVNIYYDRNLYTLRFDIGYSTTSGSGTTTDYVAMSDTEAASYAGTVYGIVNGALIALTSDGNGGWTYAGTVDVRHDYDSERYQATTGNDTPQYGVVGGNVVALSGGISYTGAENYYYSASTNTNSNNYYIPNDNGQLVQTYLYRNSNRWYRTDNGRFANPRYTNEYSGTVYTRTQQTGLSGTAYNGTIYYFNSNGNATTTGSGTPYGSTTTGQYFRLNPTNNFTYNGGTAYPSGSTRYLRVSNDDANTSYTLGFIDGSMQAILHDDQGWYYNTQQAATVPYTGTLYKQQTSSGTTTYYVSKITNSNNYNDFLSTNTNGSAISCGTTIPADFIPCGRYTEVKGGTTYTIYYSDLTAKFGQNISDRWQFSQPYRGNYGFIGWITRLDSAYWDNVVHSSIKGPYEVMDENIICVGSSPNYTSTTAENGVTHELRCRYEQNPNKYVYRIYLWDPALNGFPSTPNDELEVTSKGVPTDSATPSYTGYTEPSNVVKKVITGNENNPEQNLTSTYSAYYVTSVGYNAMIINYYYRPNEHTVYYKYGKGSDNPNASFATASKNYYYYGQSLSAANVNQAAAEEATPDGYYFDGWYDNIDGVGKKFNFDTTMPDGDIALYAVYKPLRFRIKIDPNGAEIDHIDHTNAAYAPYTSYIPNGAFNRGVIYKPGSTTEVERPADSGYRKDQSTYVNGTYGETVGEYSLTRKYIPISDTAAEVYARDGGKIYYYINTQYRATDGSSLPSDCRNALYVTSDGTESSTDELYRYWQFYHDWTQANLDGGYISGTTVLDYDTWRQIYVSPQKYRAPNSSENWTFLGWFKDDETVPYNFSDPITGEFTLQAHWRLDGGYKIQYVPKYTMPDGAEINGSMPVWEDPADNLTYSDGASTEIYKAPTGLTRNGETVTDDSVIFRGWALVAKGGTDANPIYTPVEKDSTGKITTYYEPSDPYTINVANAAADSRIYLQAIYQYRESSDRRPTKADLTLDANTGYVDTTKLPLPSWDYPGVCAVNTEDHLDSENRPTQIEFGDGQASASVHLYKYATELTEDQGGSTLSPVGQNFFAHTDGHFLLGFDNAPNERDYIATYPADSVIGVTRGDNKTVYAVWEPMVYVTFVNNTGVTANDLTFSLSSPSTDGSALEVINVADGMYGRKPLEDFGNIPLKNGESITLAFPKGAEKGLRISGTNMLGVGKKLIWNSSINLVSPDGTTTTYATDAEHSTVTYVHGDHTHDLVSGEANNTKAFSFDETMIVNKNALTVTFTSKNNDYALLLQDNYNGNGTGGAYQEYDYGEDEIKPDASTNPPTPKSQLLNTTSTRVGYSFIGWADSLEKARNRVADYSDTSPESKPWTILDLDNENEGFFSSDVVDIDGVHTKTLYGVWEAKTDAVYIYKDVPQPGNQKQAFTFTAHITGTYIYGQNADTPIDLKRDFNLVHGEYLQITSSNDSVNPIEGESQDPRTAYIETKVEVYKPKTNGAGYEKDENRSATLRWELDNIDVHRTNKFEGLSFSVSEASVDYYDTSVTLSSENIDGALSIGDSSFNENQLPQTVDTDSVSWINPTAGGTIVFTNQRQTYDINVTKELTSNTTASKIFNYTASYDDSYTNPDGYTFTNTVNLEPFTVTSDSEKTLEDIPAGVSMTITEVTDEEDNYETTVTVDSGTPTEGKSTGTFTVGLNPADSTNKIHTVKFENVLKSYKVWFRLVDQGMATTINGMFSLSSPVGSLGTDLYASSSGSGGMAPGVFYTSDKFWADTYTLNQTIIPTGYFGTDGPVITGETNRQKTPVTIKVTGKDGITCDNDFVIITGSKDDGFVVNIINLPYVNIQVNKVLDDAILDVARKFYFNVSYSYQYGDQHVTASAYPSFPKTVALDYKDDTAVEIESGSPATLHIVKGGTGLRIAEDTTRLANATDTIAQTYDTWVKFNSESTVDATLYNYGSTPITAANRNDVIIFTNKRKTVDITISKTVIADDTSGDFEFEVKILNGALPIKNYTAFNNGTLDDTRDDWITDNSGVVKKPGGGAFTLGHNDSQVIRIPVGATITVEEKLKPEQEDFAVFMTMPGVDLELVDGKAAKVKLIGPTEDKDIRVFNIPSICKVTDANRNLLYVLQEGAATPDNADDIYIPAIFPTIRGAFEGRDNKTIGGLGNYYQKNGDRYVPYSTAAKHHIEMLVDYQVPQNDVVVVDAGHDMVFTTARTDATDGYPFRREGAYAPSSTEDALPAGVSSSESVGRAVLSRVEGSTKAFFTVSSSGASDSTTFEMSELIIYGHGAHLESNVLGGCLTAYKSDVTIDHCVIYNFEAAQGGAVYTTGDSLTVSGSIFDTCISTLTGNGNGGGGIRTKAKKLGITDSTFINCEANFQAGAVYHKPVDEKNKLLPESKFELKRCTFTNCHAICSSGAAESVSPDVTVEECVFTNCYISGEPSTTRNGGAINIFANDSGNSTDASTAVFTNCTFYGCRMGGSTLGGDYGCGGGLRSTALTTTITGCTFGDYVDNTDPDNPVTYYNSAKNGGGVAVTNPNGTASINGCTFTNCTATENGGGIYSAAATLTVQKNESTQTTITGCSAKNGGGVYAANSSTTVTGATVSTCSATSGSGGGINAKSITATDLTVQSCTASSNGGGVYSTNGGSIGGTSQILYCTASNGNGGGVYAGGELTLAGTTTITGHETLTDTSAKNANNGGGVYAAALTLNDTVTVEKCKVSGSGGGIYATSIAATGAIIQNCAAVSKGGGIYLGNGGGTIGGTSQILYCKATGTGSGNGGGGIYLDNGELTLSGTTMIKGHETITDTSEVRARSGGGVYVTGSDGSLTISGATITNCNVNKVGGGAVYVTGQASITVNSGTISNNFVKASDANKVGGGAIYIDNGTGTIEDGSITGNYAKTDSTGKEAIGGAIYVVNESSLTINGGTISNNYTDTTTNGSYGGAIAVSGSNASVEIKDGTISSNHAHSTKRDAAGGAIMATEGAELTVINGEISNNYVVIDEKNSNNKDRYACGGAIAIVGTLNTTAPSVPSTMTLSGGTISGNYVSNTAISSYVKGAGIYLGYYGIGNGSNVVSPGTLNISGNPGFGGADTDEYGSFTDGSGNVLQTPISATNGTKSYTQARQDIYIAGYSGTAVESVNVTGEITSSTGAIWVWAEAGTSIHADGDHIHEEDQFAMITAASGVTDSSLAAFRNARVDTDTGATTSAFYGVKSQKSGEESYVVWGTIGGADVSFKKVNGSGEPLAGAEFTLYDSYDKARVGGPNGQISITPETGSVVDGKPNAAKSDSNGDVKFRAPVGIYYMKETVVPTGYKVTDTKNVYVVLVGSGNVSVPATQPSSGDWSSEGVLGSLASSYPEEIQSVVNSQRGIQTAGRYERDSAIFLVDGITQKAVAIPDIAASGITNESNTSYKVILRKVAEGTYASLAGARFRMFRQDLSEITEGQPEGKDYYESMSSGVYFIGSLPLGKYYLVETVSPYTTAESTDSVNTDKVFELEVKTNGMTNQVETTKRISADSSDETLKKLYSIIHPT